MPDEKKLQWILLALEKTPAYIVSLFYLGNDVPIVLICIVFILNICSLKPV